MEETTFTWTVLIQNQLDFNKAIFTKEDVLEITAIWYPFFVVLLIIIFFYKILTLQNPKKYTFF